MKTKIRVFIFCLKLGVVLFPCFFLLDLVVYPDFKFALLLIRIVVTVYLAVVLFFNQRISDDYYFPVVFITMFLISFSISLMSFITGEGFASPYYSGLLQIIIISMLFFEITPRNYAQLIIAMVAQHFILLSFIPWQAKDLAINGLGLGIFSLVAILGHTFIYHLANENKVLKGFLPICASCKKIRDDRGYWNQIESYIKDHSEAEFSHSICPDCAKTLYPDLDLYADP